MADDTTSDQDVERMRAAGLPVPETIEELRQMLEDGENSELLDLEEVKALISKRLREQFTELRESA